MIDVSFIITIYNKAPFLPHVLAGLAAQQGDFSREFIFVDDGSTDTSVAIIESWAAQSPHEVVILRQANQGPSAATNTGLAAARGTCIKPVDGDDILLPWATIRLLNAMRTLDCGMAFAAAPEVQLYLPDEPPEAILARLQPNDATPHIVPDMLKRAIRRPMTNPSMWLARTDIVRGFGGCSPRIFIQDYYLELQLAAHTGCAQIDDAFVVFPRAAEGRLTDNQAQILHDCSASLAEFLASGPRLASGLAAMALRRAATRGWLWAKRRGGENYFSAAFARHIGAMLHLMQPTAVSVRACAQPFLTSGKVRIPAGL